jgi:hypothetical protein
VGLGAINAIRETFRDEDTIRVHPIITHGGSQVNVIPGEVRIETYVRGRTVEAILDAERKVDRAFKAGALALGATVEIETLPGYLPMQCDPIMARYFRETAVGFVGEEHYRQVGHRTGSTDMGDLSQVMPILHPYMGGAIGSGHGADFAIVDKSLAYVTMAKSLAAMAVDMLADGAQGPARCSRRLDPHDARACLTFSAGSREAGVLGLRFRRDVRAGRRRVSSARRLPQRRHHGIAFLVGAGSAWSVSPAPPGIRRPRARAPGSAASRRSGSIASWPWSPISCWRSRISSAGSCRI